MLYIRGQGCAVGLVILNSSWGAGMHVPLMPVELHCDRVNRSRGRRVGSLLMLPWIPTHAQTEKGRENLGSLVSLAIRGNHRRGEVFLPPRFEVFRTCFEENRQFEENRRNF